MPIPDFQMMMLPLLKCLVDGKEHQNSDIYEKLEDKFDMTEKEKQELLPSGKQRVFVNRIGWAKSYLKQAGLVESPKRGYYKISQEGSEVLAKNPEKIDINYLMKFPSFVEFRRGKDNDNDKKLKEPIQDNCDTTEKTPEEYIEIGVDSIVKKLKQEIVLTIKSCSPLFFEKLVIDLLLSMGYGGSRQEAGRLTNKGSDEGVDGIINEDKLGLDVIYVQAKRWEGSVSRPEIQKFAGALQGKRANKGIYITTSFFTKEAQEFTKSITSKIILIDGDKLSELMIEHDVGVNVVQTFKLKKIDTDYFVED